MLGDERFEAGLVERRLALVDGVDFAGIHIDADDAKAEFSEAGGGDTSDVTESEYRDDGFLWHKCFVLMSAVGRNSGRQYSSYDGSESRGSYRQRGGGSPRRTQRARRRQSNHGFTRMIRIKQYQKREFTTETPEVRTVLTLSQKQETMGRSLQRCG